MHGSFTERSQCSRSLNERRTQDVSLASSSPGPEAWGKDRPRRSGFRVPFAKPRAANVPGGEAR